MQHSYDLLLQGKSPGDAVPLDGLIAALGARGATLSPEGRGTWKLAEGEVDIAPLMEAGTVKGLDVRVPFHDQTALVEAVAKELVDLSAATGTRLTDPQRGDSVTLTSLSAVIDEYLRMARYAGEYGGVGAALGLSTHVSATSDRDSSSFRWLLVLMVFLMAVYAGFRTIEGLRAAREAATEEAPGPVNGPPKVPRK